MIIDIDRLPTECFENQMKYYAICNEHNSKKIYRAEGSAACREGKNLDSVPYTGYIAYWWMQGWNYYNNRKDFYDPKYDNPNRLPREDY